MGYTHNEILYNNLSLFLVLGAHPESVMLGKYSTTEPHIQPWVALSFGGQLGVFVYFCFVLGVFCFKALFIFVYVFG